MLDFEGDLLFVETHRHDESGRLGLLDDDIPTGKSCRRNLKENRRHYPWADVSQNWGRNCNTVDNCNTVENYNTVERLKEYQIALRISSLTLRKRQHLPGMIHPIYFDNTVENTWLKL
jgi:hypothetical protein